MNRRTFLQTSGVVVGVAMAGRASAAERRPVMVTVTTCQRPRGASYVAGTLAAVDAGLPKRDVRKLLISDGPSIGTAIQGWETLELPDRPRRHGPLPDNKAVGWEAIRAAAHAGADLLFLEDDIRPVRPGAFAAMLAHETPEWAAFTTFFHPRRQPGAYASIAFEMSQAVLIPRRSLAWLVDGPAIQRGDWDAVTGVDIAIAVLGRAAGWRFEQTPNLVEHIGLVSSVH